MSELWDVYDKNRNKTGKIVERGTNTLQEGEYHIVVTGIIINSKNEILISKRADFKKYGGLWECNGGSVLSGETSLESIIRELKEELGINCSKEEAIYLKEIRKENPPADFKDLWLFSKEIDIKDISFPDGEAVEAKWVSIEEFINMQVSGLMVPSIDFGIKEYEIAMEKLKK